MKIYYIYSALTLVLLMPLDSYATKKHCQKYLDKLDNIQSKQRAGYSAKQGVKLAEREQKARDNWWNCQTGKLKKKTKKSRKQPKYNSNKVNFKQIHIPQSNIKPLTNKLYIKGRYQGTRQQQWLDFYQQPKKCRKPKSLSAFAFCMEDKQEQQRVFESQKN